MTVRRPGPGLRYKASHIGTCKSADSTPVRDRVWSMCVEVLGLRNLCMRAQHYSRRRRGEVNLAVI